MRRNFKLGPRFQEENLPERLVFIVNESGQALTTVNLDPGKTYILGFTTAEKALEFVQEQSEENYSPGSYHLSFLTKTDYLTNIRGTSQKIIVDVKSEEVRKGSNFLVIRWQPRREWYEKPMIKI